ncbi:Membrane protein, putative [plant metagenome]|uniref:Membrane protein, putative n=1 Tax=plant metagenome TaxID=1297885 RepID=A0A484QZS1_9ZZZZ
MAGSSFFALFDDIALLLDDVAAMSKVALKKSAGVLGDDLALNAQQVTGVPVNRELPVVWAVAKGSLINKAILVPAALLISAFSPWLVTPLLMLGGAFLCYEGFEKVMHRFLHAKDSDHAARVKALQDPDVDIVAFEKTKIKGAIRTDFILSAEIIAIALGAVAGASLLTQALVLSSIALLVTVGVYALVAGIVRLDDWGIALSQRGSAFSQRLGRSIVAAAPYLMKTLSIVGTAAMFMVGGAILVHGVPAIAHAVEATVAAVGTSGLAQGAVGILLEAGVGVVAGGIIVGVVVIAKKMLGRGD